MNVDCYTSAVAIQQIILWMSSDKLTSEKMKSISRLVYIDTLMEDVDLLIRSNNFTKDTINTFQQIYKNLDDISEVYSVCDNITMDVNDPDIENIAYLLMNLKFDKSITDSMPNKTKSVDEVDEDMGITCTTTEMVSDSTNESLVDSYDCDYNPKDIFSKYEDEDLEIPYQLLVSSS